MANLLLDSSFLIDVLNDREGRADLMERWIFEEHQLAGELKQQWGRKGKTLTLTDMLIAAVLSARGLYAGDRQSEGFSHAGADVI